MSPAARAAVLLALAAACAPAHDRARSRLARLARAERPPAGTNWPLPPPALEHDFVHHQFEIRSHEPIGKGVTGAAKQKVVVTAHGDEFAVKWKDAPGRDVDGWNNSPRKEIAAYEIQKWFLDPADYVVPTTALRCVPVARYGAELGGDDPEPTLAATRCVLGTVTVWLEDVSVPERLYDEERFLGEPRYAYHMVSFNLLTYLVDHRDGRKGNFLVSRDDGNRRVFAVDNGISFGDLLFNYFVPNWNRIRVPALRREVVERLRRRGREDFDRLGALTEMRADAHGILRHVEPTANVDAERGVRIRPGWIQLGLTRGEIAGVAARVEALLAAVDAGRVAVY